MTGLRNSHWEQWEAQEQRRLAKIAKQQKDAAEDEAHRQLSNLYLSIERGYAKMSITNGNALRTLLSKAYPEQDFYSCEIKDHWMAEFTKLPGWNNF